MINYKALCLNCMNITNGANPCPYCGFNMREYHHFPHHLPMKTIVGGRFLVGEVLGEGGFGITYIGIDLTNGTKLAIKEYYPNGFVTRKNSNTVCTFQGQKHEMFKRGRDRFLNEAEMLARFKNQPGIVTVFDYFEENATAYIVMEYIDGMTFKNYLDKNGGMIQVDQLFEMMRPALMSLSQVHYTGLIHRDISPDNLMMTSNGDVKLIDFGAARDFTQLDEKSRSILLKPGYAPEEQYRSKGVQGPWTDVYAMCATIYKCITGVTPEDSCQRMSDDTLKRPSELGISIDKNKENAILKGLNIYQNNRQQNVDILFREIYGYDPNQAPVNVGGTYVSIEPNIQEGYNPLPAQPINQTTYPQAEIDQPTTYPEAEQPVRSSGNDEVYNPEIYVTDDNNINQERTDDEEIVDYDEFIRSMGSSSVTSPSDYSPMVRNSPNTSLIIGVAAGIATAILAIFAGFLFF